MRSRGGGGRSQLLILLLRRPKMFGALLDALVRASADPAEFSLVAGCYISLFVPVYVDLVVRLIQIVEGKVSSIYTAVCRVSGVDCPEYQMGWENTWTPDVTDDLIAACTHPTHRKTAFLYGLFITAGMMFSVVIFTMIWTSMWPRMWRFLGFVYTGVDRVGMWVSGGPKPKVRTE